MQGNGFQFRKKLILAYFFLFNVEAASTWNIGNKQLQQRISRKEPCSLETDCSRSANEEISAWGMRASPLSYLPCKLNTAIFYKRQSCLYKCPEMTFS